MWSNLHTKTGHMKKLGLILMLGIIVFPGCDFIKEKFGSGETESLLEANQQLDSALKAERSQHQEELNTLQAQSRAKIDSIINYYEEKMTATGPRQASKGYYLITGSFKTPQYAKDYNQKMKSMGYQSEIIMAPNGFHLVSVEKYNNASAAVEGLELVRNAVVEDSWIYVAR